MKQGQVVFRAGDMPDAFFLILSGSVSIFVPKTKDEIRIEKAILEGEVQNLSGDDQKIYEDNKKSKILSNDYS